MTTAHETKDAAKVSEGWTRLGVGVAGCGAFGYYTWDANTMPLGDMAMPGPGLFPLIIGTLGLVSALIVILDSVPRIRKDSSIAVPGGQTARRVIGMMVLLTAYVVIIGSLGTYLASILFCCLSIKLLSGHTWWRSALYGVTMAVICVFIFDSLLNVSLPRFNLW